MLTNKVMLFKNGQGHVAHIYEVDSSKPICQLVGNCYEFNSRLVKSIYFMTTEQLITQLEK